VPPDAGVEPLAERSADAVVKAVENEFASSTWVVARGDASSTRVAASAVPAFFERTPRGRSALPAARLDSLPFLRVRTEV
jgi:hypothetical protein